MGVWIMDDQRIKDSNPCSVSDPVRCLICLNTFSGQPLASPQHCDHLYCLTCITEWAKTTNSCPVDRLRFTVLYQRSCVGKDIQKIITVESYDGQGLEEEGQAEELSVCEECGRSDRRHLMLLCSACDSRFHIACVRPPLTAVPNEDWFCQECVTEDSQTNGSFSRDGREIDEAELMALLSEVAPTSSRLRSSTTSQHGASVHRRRSERLKQQNSRTHITPHTQTVKHVPRYLLKSSRSGDDEAMTSDFLLNSQKVNKCDTRRRKTDVLNSV